MLDINHEYNRISVLFMKDKAERIADYFCCSAKVADMNIGKV